MWLIITKLFLLPLLIWSTGIHAIWSVSPSWIFCILGSLSFKTGFYTSKKTPCSIGSGWLFPSRKTPKYLMDLEVLGNFWSGVKWYWKGKILQSLQICRCTSCSKSWMFLMRIMFVCFPSYLLQTWCITNYLYRSDERCMADNDEQVCWKMISINQKKKKKISVKNFLGTVTHLQIFHIIKNLTDFLHRV